LGVINEHRTNNNEADHDVGLSNPAEACRYINDLDGFYGFDFRLKSYMPPCRYRLRLSLIISPPVLFLLILFNKPAFQNFWRSASTPFPARDSRIVIIKPSKFDSGGYVSASRTVL
jgi:hypothetical protein